MLYEVVKGVFEVGIVNQQVVMYVYMQDMLYIYNLVLSDLDYL